MAIEEVTPESLASLLFHYQAELAADLGCPSTGAKDWREVPANERQHMIAAARLTLLDLLHSARTRHNPLSRNSEHRPEEGREWGC